MLHENAHLLVFWYGIFLICCGIAAVIFIGMKAKTALASGSIAGLSAISLGHLMSTGANAGYWGAIFLTLALFCVFSWRATKTLHAVFVLIPQQHADLKGKGIAFLIISLMAIVSIVVCLVLSMAV